MDVEIETQVTITLDKRQARLAEANSGLPITLPTLTQHIVLRIKRDDADDGSGESARL